MTVMPAAMGQRSETTERPSMSFQGELLTVGFSMWALFGAFLDGWAHTKPGWTETFFTPFHAVFYSGFATMAAWVIWSILQNRRTGYHGQAAIPVGYGQAVVGLITFGVGSVADFLWHYTFGIERAGERLASPAHLLLFIGGTLVITSPLRAAWAARTPGSAAPSLRDFLPALLSMTLLSTTIAFFAFNIWGFRSAEYLGTLQLDAFLHSVAPDAARSVRGLLQAHVFASVLITNLILLAPVLVLLRRWRLPFGSCTILFTFPTLWMTGLAEFRFSEAILAALTAGVVADVLCEKMDLAPTRLAAFRTFATVVPVVLWSSYFLVTVLLWGVAASPPMWAGAIFFTGMSGLGLSLVMAPAPFERA